MSLDSSSAGGTGSDRSGYSRADLLATLAGIAVLAALVVVPLHLHRERRALVSCLDNLRQTARATLQYAAARADTLPGPEPVEGQLGDSWWWYKEKVKGYAGLSGPASEHDRVFACPRDRGYTERKPFRRTARFAFGSYVFNGVNLHGIPNLAGWKIEHIAQPARTLLVMEWSAHAPLSWHRSRTGQRNHPFYRDAESVVAFVDGRAAMIPMYYDGYNAAYTRDPMPGYDYRYSGR